MKVQTILKIILITIIVLIELSISTVYAASIASNNYKLTTIDAKNYIIGIYQSTRLENFRKNIITTETIKVYDNKGEQLEETEIIQTGNKIKIGQDEYIAIVCGDTNGDGKAGVTDLLDVKKHLIRKEKLKNEKKVAADVDASNKVTNTDILNLKRLIVRIIEERQIFESEYTNEEYEYKKNKLTDKVTIVKLANNKGSGILQIPNKIDGNDVTKIEDNLGENNRITRVTVSKNIESISNIAFSGMRELNQIEVNKENKQYSSKEGVLYSKDGTKLLAYPRAKIEEEYYIEETVKEIGEYAFYKNNSLETLYIPETIEKVAKNAFEEMQGKVYIKENSKVKSILDKEEIEYTVDKVPQVTKLTYSIGTNQVITINIQASDAEGIVAWCIGKKDDNNDEWNIVDNIKSLETTYTETIDNGTYVLKVKDKVGNVGSKDLKITGVNLNQPKVTEMKIISPATGEYKPGQKIIIRVDFNEKIKGKAPTLKLRIGDTIGTGSMTTSEITGNTKYIYYTYITNEEQLGIVNIYSYSGGTLTDSKGNRVILATKQNSGNEVVIKTNRGTLVKGKVYMIEPTDKQTVDTHYGEWDVNKWHYAIDIYDKMGSNIYAVADGTVTGIDTYRNGIGEGTEVKISHGYGVQTWYLHMFPEDIKVKVGDKVKQGQVIGYMGNSATYKPHLHFVLFIDGVNTDPQYYIYLNDRLQNKK